MAKSLTNKHFTDMQYLMHDRELNQSQNPDNISGSSKQLAGGYMGERIDVHQLLTDAYNLAITTEDDHKTPQQRSNESKLGLKELEETVEAIGILICEPKIKLG